MGYTERMKSEIEAKFLNIDFEQIRAKLSSLGGQLVKPMRMMHRVTIDTPAMKAKDAFLRVRDEGDKVTMTYKQFDALALDGVKEIEITTDSFDNAVELLTAAGLPHHSLQESRRETWELGEVEIVLDEWPWLNPYIEIEGPAEDSVKEAAAKLSLDWKNAVFGDVMTAYRAQYPHLSLQDTVGNIPIVKFGDPLPELLKSYR